MTPNEFLINCNNIHGTKYDYSKSEYINHGTKLLVKCNICLTEWMVRPLHHIGKSKSGCPICANLSRKKLKSKTTAQFIEEASTLHKNKYDYSLADYISNTTNVKIKCLIHGIFKQSPSVHLAGFGCKICSGYKSEIAKQTEFSIYKQQVWSYTNKSYRRYKSTINPAAIERSKEFHLDHKFSIIDGYNNNILPSIIGHYKNLQILSAKDNRLKWDTSCITLKELLSFC
jgi:hypothetical protein